LGYKEEELVGKLGHDIFHEHAQNDYTPKEECPIYKAFLQGVSFLGEEIFRTKKGELIVAEISCTPLLDDQTPSEYVVLFRDITKRKRIEEEAMALSRIVREAQDIIVIKDLNLRVISANMAFAKVAGKESVAELVGKTDAEIFETKETVEPIKSYMEDDRYAQTLPQGESLEKEEPVVLEDGQIRIYKTRKFPVHNSKGKLIATANISMDITDQKAYEAKLKQQVRNEETKRSENEAFFNKIFETANLGICLTDKDGRFVVVNPAYCKIYGYNETELIGHHFTKVVPEENRQYMRELHDAFIYEEAAEIPRERDVVGKDGKELHIVATAGKLDNIVGGPYKITTIADMTEAHEARKLQNHHEALLIQQSKLASMGEMLGAIAHQWRQPLNVINCTTLDMRLKKQMGLLDDAYFDNAIAELGRMTQSMSRTIDDFMNFFKPSKQKKLFSLHECINYAADILSAQLNSHGIEVKNEVPKEVQIFGTIGELEQVILNLISNARDAFEETVPEKKEIRLHVDPSTKEEVVLLVDDTAGGMDEKVVGKIFEPYFTTKGDKQGTGIGLYMCGTIIEKTFGGSISATNWYNEKNERMGARIVLGFPVKDAE
jgi:two-component system CheB/CheR fusion protein